VSSFTRPVKLISIPNKTKQETINPQVKIILINYTKTFLSYLVEFPKILKEKNKESLRIRFNYLDFQSLCAKVQSRRLPENCLSNGARDRVPLQI